MAWANDNTEVIAFAIENPGYEAALLDTYGAEYEDTLVVEGAAAESKR